MTEHIDHLLKILERKFPGEDITISINIHSFGGERMFDYFVHLPKTTKLFHDIKKMDKFIRQFEDLTVDALLGRGGM